tara:strand:+ start:30 stop:242 length:213 start_codon:yes stop_codon:yes gene_type:complete
MYINNKLTKRETMKLTKKEQEFLLSWLSDDLDIIKKDIERHQDNKEVMEELKPKEKIFSSIMKKLTKGII